MKLINYALCVCVRADVRATRGCGTFYVLTGAVSWTLAVCIYITYGVWGQLSCVSAVATNK